MAANRSPGASASAVESGGRGAGVLANELTFQAPCSQTSVDGLCPPGLLRLDGGAAADDADVPDRDVASSEE